MTIFLEQEDQTPLSAIGFAYLVLNSSLVKSEYNFMLSSWLRRTVIKPELTMDQRQVAVGNYTQQRFV